MHYEIPAIKSRFFPDIIFGKRIRTIVLATYLCYTLRDMSKYRGRSSLSPGFSKVMAMEKT